MKFFLPFLFLFAVFGAASCMWGLPEDSDQADDWEMPPLCNACLKAAPDADALEITIPEKDDKKADPLTVGEMAEYYDFTVDVSRDLNFWILGILSQLDEILSYPPTQSDGDTCTWGPFIPDGLSPVEMRFSMTKLSDTDFEYVWDERPKNTDDEFTPIWGGHITPATDTARRGIGNLYIDWTAAQLLDPTWDVSGRMDVDYDTYTDGREIDIVFDQFVTEDAGYPIDADYHYHNFADNSGEFQFVYQADFPLDGDPDDSGMETVNQETYWHENGEGYSTQVISGGDIEGFELLSLTLDHLQGYECWNENFLRTYFKFEAIDDVGDATVLEEEGSAADCPAF